MEELPPVDNSLHNKNNAFLEKVKNKLLAIKIHKFFALIILVFLIAVGLTAYLHAKFPAKNDKQPKESNITNRNPDYSPYTPYTNNDNPSSIKREPRVFISKADFNYSSNQFIPLTSQEEPAIYLNYEDYSGSSKVSVYETNTDTLLNDLIYKQVEYGNVLSNKVDVTKMSLVKNIDVPAPAKDSSKVLLPLAKKGVYYIFAKTSDDSAWDGAFVVVSKYGILAKESKDETIFWGMDISTKKSITDGNLKIYNLKDKLNTLDNVAFKGDGTALGKLSSRNDLAVAEIQNEKVIIPLNYKNVEYNYGEFKERKNNQRYFVFTDRPLYKPGDTIYYKAVGREEEDARYTISDHPVQVSIYLNGDDPIYKTTSQFNEFGTVSGSYQLPETATPDDYYTISVVDASEGAKDRWDYSSYGSSYFAVQFYRKPEYHIDVNAEDKTYISGDELKFTVQGNYFSGQPISGGEVRYHILGGDYYDYLYSSEAEKLTDDYRYSNWAYNPIKEGTLTFDSSGEAVFDDALVIPDNYKKNQVISIEVEYAGSSGDPVFARKNLLFYRGEYSIYLKDYLPYSSKKNEKVTIPLKLKANRGGSISGIKLKASGTWERWDYDGTAQSKDRQYQDIKGTTPEFEITTNSTGEASLSFTPVEKGSYDITVMGSDSKGNLISREVNLYVNDTDFERSWYNAYFYTAQQPISISSDKKVYKPGDTAKLTISSEIKDTDVLVTFERGRTSRYKIVNVKGDKSTFDFPIEETDMPNIFAVASTFSDSALARADLNIAVPAESKKISIDIKPSQNRYGAGDNAEFEVTTKDYLGKPISSEVAIWAIDKAIYELKDKNTYEIYDAFWFDRYNDTATSNSLEPITSNSAEMGGGCFAGDTQILMSDNSTKNISDVKIGDSILTRASDTEASLVQAKVTGLHKTTSDGYFIINGNLKITPNHILNVNNKWLDAGHIQKGDVLLNQSGLPVEVNSVEWMRNKADVYNLQIENYHTFFADGYWVHNEKDGGNLRSSFKDTAYWNPNLRTDENGKAKVIFKLPDNLTTWVVAGIAVTQDTKVGTAAKEIVVSRNVIVRNNLPNILRKDDKARVSSLVQNFTDSDQDFDIKMNFDSGTTSDSDRTIRINKNSSQELFWDITPQKINPDAKITVSATSKSDPKAADAVASKVPVILYGFYEERGQSKIGPADYQVKLNDDSLNDKTSIDLAISANPLGTLPSAMKYLVQYPYGCVEQTTSRMIPAIIAKENPTMYAEILQSKDVDAYIKESIRKLEDTQSSNGAWSWISTSKQDDYLSAYVYEYILKASDMGYTVKPETIAKAKGYFRGINDITYTDEVRISKIIAAYALSLTKEKESAQITNYAGLTPEILSMAVISNYNNGLTDANANGLTALISMAKSSGDSMYWDAGDRTRFGSVESSTASAIQALIKGHADSVTTGKAVRYLVTGRKNNYWANTFGTAQAIRSITEYAKSENALDTNLTYSVSINNKVLSTGMIKSYKQSISNISIDPTLIGPDSVINVIKQGTGQIYTDLLVREFRTQKNTAKQNNGLEITRTYVSEKGAGRSIGVGDLVDVYIKVSANSTLADGYGIVHDVLPTGLVSVNSSFKNEQFNESNQDYYSYSPEFGLNDVKLYSYGFSDTNKAIFHYKARAISEGTFNVPPAFSSLMYTPEIYGRSASQILVVDKTSDYFKAGEPNFIADQEIAKEKIYDASWRNNIIPSMNNAAGSIIGADNVAMLYNSNYKLTILIGLLIVFVSILVLYKRRRAHLKSKSDSEKTKNEI